MKISMINSSYRFIKNLYRPWQIVLALSGYGLHQKLAKNS